MDGRILFLAVVIGIMVIAWIGAGVLWRAAEVAELVAPLEEVVYDELSVVTVGTGNLFENPERFGPATAIGLGDAVVLVDAGRGVAEGLRAARIPLDQPAVVYLTNLLPYNTMGLDDLLHTGWLGGRGAPLRVVGPTGTRAFVEQLTAAHALGREALVDALDLPDDGVRIEVVEVGDGHAEGVGDLRVEARDLPGGPLPTLAWRFTDGVSRVVVGGNGWGRDALVRFAARADALVHEAAYLPTIAELEGTGVEIPPEDAARIELERKFHTPIADVGKIAAEAQVARLVLVRLRPPPFFELQPRSLVANNFAGEISIPQDGEVVFP